MGIHFISQENVVHWFQKEGSANENCTEEVTLIKFHSLEYFKDDPLQLFPKLSGVYSIVIYSYNYPRKDSVSLYHTWKSMEAHENWTQTWGHWESDIKNNGYLQKLKFFFHDLLQGKPLAHSGRSSGTKMLWKNLSSVADWQLFNKSSKWLFMRI